MIDVIPEGAPHDAAFIGMQLFRRNDYYSY
jgi:hypothetical protein